MLKVNECEIQKSKLEYWFDGGYVSSVKKWSQTDVQTYSGGTQMVVVGNSTAFIEAAPVVTSNTVEITEIWYHSDIENKAIQLRFNGRNIQIAEGHLIGRMWIGKPDKKQFTCTHLMNLTADLLYEESNIPRLARNYFYLADPGYFTLYFFICCAGIPIFMASIIVIGVITNIVLSISVVGLMLAKNNLFNIAIQIVGYVLSVVATFYFMSKLFIRAKASGDKVRDANNQIINEFVQESKTGLQRCWAKMREIRDARNQSTATH